MLVRARIAWYRRRWECNQIVGSPQLRAPALLVGSGRISFGLDVVLGWEAGPGFYAGYTYMEARHPGSTIALEAGSHLNNGVVIVSEGPGITIGEACLIGPGVHVYDSDFHPLAAGERSTQLPARAEVAIGADVFIGTNALILKGSRIGDGATVGAGAVVSGEVAAGTIVAGNPAKEVGRSPRTA